MHALSCHVEQRLNEWIIHLWNKICLVMHKDNAWKFRMYEANVGTTSVFMSPREMAQ